MKRLEMSNITTAWNDATLLCPGGWQAFVPEIQVDSAAFDAYVSQVLDDVGGNPERAEQLVEDTMQQVFERGYVRGIEYSIRHWMKVYAERWPRLINGDGTLEGFRPEIMHRFYFPSDNVGRAGKRRARQALAEMANEALEVRDA